MDRYFTACLLALGLIATGAEAQTARLLIEVRLDCPLWVDGEAIAELSAGDVRVVEVVPGAHIVACRKDGVAEPFARQTTSVEAGLQKLVVIAAPEPAPEQPTVDSPQESRTEILWSPGLVGLFYAEGKELRERLPTRRNPRGDDVEVDVMHYFRLKAFGAPEGSMNHKGMQGTYMELYSTYPVGPNREAYKCRKYHSVESSRRGDTFVLHMGMGRFEGNPALCNKLSPVPFEVAAENTSWAKVMVTWTKYLEEVDYWAGRRKTVPVRSYVQFTRCENECVESTRKWMGPGPLFD